MSRTLDLLRAKAKQSPQRVVFPEGQDPRVIEAARSLADEGLARPVVLVHDAFDPDQGDLAGIELLETRSGATLEACAETYFRRRQAKGMTLEGARAALADPLLMAAVLVGRGDVRCGVAGSKASTAEVLRAAIRGIGAGDGGSLVSSFFLMELTDGRVLTYTDCGVIPAPTPPQLAEIAVDAAMNHQRLTEEVPRVAFLSFSTLGSAAHEVVDRTQEATALAKERRPDLAIEGELQVDAALVPEVAQRKAPGSEVAGQANVLVFPDLNSGNIAYKITERLAGAKALGPLLQGLAAPFMDLSRGCSSDDIVDVAVVAQALAD